MTQIRAVLVGVDEYERADVPSLQRLRQRRRPRPLAAQAVLRGSQRGHPRRRQRPRDEGEHPAIGLEDTIARAQPGDVLVFYYSGHGSQVRDRNGDELTDGLDEIICPYDMDWDRGTYILDDDLDAIFASAAARRPARGVLRLLLLGRRRARARARAQAGAPASPTCATCLPPFDIAARAEGDEAQLDIHQLRACECLRRAQRRLGRLAGGPAVSRGLHRRPTERHLHLLGLPVHRGEHRARRSPRVHPRAAAR